MGLTASNVFAGSNGTATTLRTIFYYLLKQPETMKKLLTELDEASFDREGAITGWKDARKLPYLTAVVQEALRIFPAVGVLSNVSYHLVVSKYVGISSQLEL